MPSTNPPLVVMGANPPLGTMGANPPLVTMGDSLLSVGHLVQQSINAACLQRQYSSDGNNRHTTHRAGWKVVALCTVSLVMQVGTWWHCGLSKLEVEPRCQV